MEKIAKFFKFEERNTNFKVETIAGLTTFMTMAYVLVTQPGAICGFGAEAGVVDMNGVMVTKEAIMILTSLVSGLITLLMAFYSNFPFALSTGMGTNFILGAMIQNGTLSYAQAMGMILITGIIFIVLSVFGIRDLIVRMIPKNIKVSIGTAIGFFIAYLGFSNSGICDFSAGLNVGDFTDKAVLLAIAGLGIIAVLTAFKVNGAILIGIVIITIVGIPMGITAMPDAIAKVPQFSTVSDIIFKFDLTSIWTAEGIVLMFIAFFGDFFSTLGTVLGVAGRAHMLDEDGNLPGIEKPFLVDAVGTTVGACFGCTTITTFVESTAGVEAGGRTGWTAVVTGVLFLIFVFLSPLALMVPNAATGPALIFVGFLMIQGIKDIDFSDFTEAFGPFVMIVFGAFSASIAVGIAAGILSYIFIKLCTGKFKEIHPGMYILAIPLILYFIYM
ncbi:NCS2 family permease [Anaerolentibacter hominis]|uniref:NCS2 family permease n=1 Tax=Anaerolentibacter hominis TaxID=3079009 RepID=UPI0031B8895B